jgi:HAD superfamily hydrolase (TIGR01509 family)
MGGSAALLPAPVEGRRDRTAPVRRPLDVDALAAGWWVALDAAQSALRAAGPSLGPQELGDRGRHLAEERAGIVQLLGALAGDLHAESRLLPLLAASTITRRMLGLPEEVLACVFDLDGVLTTSATAHTAAWTETFDTFLLARAERSRHPFVPFDPRRDYEDLVAGRPRLDGVRAFLASRGISLAEGTPDDPPGAESVHGLANRKNQSLQRLLDREGVAPFEGSRCYLEAARMLGLRRGVVSASAHTATMLERAGLDHLIERRIDGNTIASEKLPAKPAPDTLLAACRQLGVPPSQTVVFETTPAGIAAARAAGARFAVGVDRDGHISALRASDADLVVNDLTELLDR